MAAAAKKISAIQRKILDALKAHPEGLSTRELRDVIGGEEGKQEWLNRRLRDLRSHFNIPSIKGRYVYQGERAAPADDAAITGRMRAKVLHKAHMRCEMCGKTVKEDGVKLEADHKIPRNWGGTTTEDNLWALCQACNNGKRDFFGSLDEEQMTKLVHLESVYQRIAEVLHQASGKPVPSWYLEFVANFDDFQEDWQKRLRELRYPVIGMVIKVTRAKTSSGKVQAAYQLVKWVPLPPDHSQRIKQYERDLRKKNKWKKS